MMERVNSAGRFMRQMDGSTTYTVCGTATHLIDLVGADCIQVRWYYPPIVKAPVYFQKE
jgi:hypothetical protein